MTRTNFTIGKKLFLSFGAALVASIVMGLVTFSSIARMSATYNTDGRLPDGSTDHVRSRPALRRESSPR